MVINTNTTAQNAANNLQQNQVMLSKSLARLSSGSKIINPSDDAGGLAVSMRLDSQVSRLGAAKTNVSNAISFNQTQDGYLGKIGKAFDRMGELAILAQDPTKSAADHALYGLEFTQLSNYITGAASKQFNGVALFSAANLTITTDGDDGTVAMNGIDMTTPPNPYVTATASTIDTPTNAATALTNIKAAMDQVSKDRATVGSYQSRLNYTADQITITSENLTAATSRIKDVDVAEESMQFAKSNILVQSATAMLAQANQLPQSVLKLLQ